MTLNEVMAELEKYGNPGTKKVFLKHGAKEPFFGVKVGDLKKIVKKVKKDHTLALELYSSGNSDAMYLAGLVADETQMTKDLLQQWVKDAYWYMISEYTVPWIAAETEHGLDLAKEWIEEDDDGIQSAGWATLSSILATKNNEDLDIAYFDSLLDRVEKTINTCPNRSRYTMNNYVIAIGSYVPELTVKAKKLGGQIGKVQVNVGDTSCKVPFSPDYIEKVEKRGSVGKKRKGARC